MTDISPQHYQVGITPLIDSNTYGTEIDVSDCVVESSLGTINEELEGSDFEINFFKYGTITIRLQNQNGRFSDEFDSRSMFNFKRDQAKVKITFYDNTQTDTIVFDGIVNEESTRIDNDYVNLFIASRDSIIRKTEITSGLISNGDLFSEGIKKILNREAITKLFNYDPDDVTVDLDLTIDDTSVFDGRSSKGVLNDLLTASNSVLLIIDDGVVVKPRQENSGKLFTFYVNDTFGRDNVLDFTNISSGLNRAFNSVIINNSETGDVTFKGLNGVREIEYSFDFLTDPNKIAAVSLNIVENFKIRKREIDLLVRSKDAKDISKLDLINLNFKYRLVPYKTDYLPTFGKTTFGSERFPYEKGGFKISPKFAFKVIGKKEDPKTFTTILRLRERGITINDGGFSSRFGEAIFGQSIFASA